MKSWNNLIPHSVLATELDEQFLKQPVQAYDKHGDPIPTFFWKKSQRKWLKSCMDPNPEYKPPLDISSVPELFADKINKEDLEKLITMLLKDK